MDKLMLELLELLQGLLGAHERMLLLARARQEAMRGFDIEAMNRLMEREREELKRIGALELQRRGLMGRWQAVLGRGVAPTISGIAGRCGEPTRSQLLGLAGRLRGVVEELERTNRINGTVSQAVLKSLAKVFKVVTGVAQHAGLYMRNGRRATMHGIHLLDAVA